MGQLFPYNWPGKRVSHLPQARNLRESQKNSVFKINNIFMLHFKKSNSMVNKISKLYLKTESVLLTFLLPQAGQCTAALGRGRRWGHIRADQAWKDRGGGCSRWVRVHPLSFSSGAEVTKSVSQNYLNLFGHGTFKVLFVVAIAWKLVMGHRTGSVHRPLVDTGWHSFIHSSVSPLIK